MKHIRNQRGAALLYVLMVFMVLMVLAPLILSAASNATLRDTTDKYDKAANQLAVSSMEAFIAYLDAYATGDRIAYFNSYPGPAAADYTTPEGYKVKYSMAKPTVTTAGNYNVTASATVMGSDGNYSRSKALTYQFHVANPAAGVVVTTDDTDRVPVDAKDQVFYEKALIKNKEPTGPSGGPVEITKVAGLHDAIEAAINHYTSTTQSEIAALTSQAVNVSCNNSLSAVQTAIDASSANPVILHMSGSCLTNNAFSAQWGSPSRPVILIFDSLTFNDKVDLITIYGDLIVTGSMITDNKNKIRVLSSQNGRYGDIYMMGGLNGNNGVDLIAQDTIYAKNMELNNGAALQGQNIYVQDKLNLNNNAEITANRDILTGSIMVNNNNTQATAKLGDILVKDSLTYNNNADFVSGGLIAIGDTLTINNNNTFDTGSTTYGTGSTSLILNGTGGSSGTSSWNPVRQP